MKILLIVLLAMGGSTVLGVLIGLAVRQFPHKLDDAVLGFAADVMLAAAGGATLYVISDEMIPETHAHGYEKPATFALVAGLVLVLVLQRLTEGL